LVKHPEAALLLAPGLGKTSVTLAAFAALRKAGTARKMLVIAPRRPCYSVWSSEAPGELWRWKDFHDLRVTLLHGPHKDDRLEEDSDIFVINFDGLVWLIEKQKYLTKLIKRGVDILAVDELSRFKHPKSKRFKLLKPHLGRFSRRWGLTGSPATNGLLDLFGQIYMVDLGKSLGRYISHYRTKFFVPSGYRGYKWKLQDGAERRIYQAIKPVALSMKAEDHLDLPKLVEQDVYVDIPSEAQKTYAEMEGEFITLLKDGVITAANAGVASLKCRQIASGGLYAQDENQATTLEAVKQKIKSPPPTRRRKTLHIHHAKTEALEDLVSELQGSPLLVAYEFEHDLQRIMSILGKDVPALKGGTSDKKANKLIQQWNAGQLPVLCGHPAAMGHGLNLQQSGYHVCWYSLPWDFEMYDQTIRRVYRHGSTAERVFVHRLIARDTLDEVVASVLRAKQRRQDALFKALKAHIRRSRS
jgi:SNF2 family DNA or RNA helicase